MWPYNPNTYPMTPQGNPYAQHLTPQIQVTRVNGRGGAEAYPMGPNSSALLLDEGGAIVWVVTTDGAGYKTVSPYDITPPVDAPPPDFTGLEARLKRLEEIVNGNTVNPTAARSTGNVSTPASLPAPSGQPASAPEQTGG